MSKKYQLRRPYPKQGHVDKKILEEAVRKNRSKMEKLSQPPLNQS